MLRGFRLFVHRLENLLDIGTSYSTISIGTKGECYLTPILIGANLIIDTISFVIGSVTSSNYTHGTLVVLWNFV